MIWTDNMLIPKGGNVYGASVLMNWYYDPKIAAEVADYVNYICPVVGADKVLLKTDPAIAKNPLIFPTKAMLAQRPPVRPEGAQQRGLQEEVPAPDRRLTRLLHRRKGAIPYLLLAPGLAWLFVFFVLPMWYLGEDVALAEGSSRSFTFDWAWGNFHDAVSTYQTQFIRSGEYAAIATALALAVSYPLAYWIAFRGGRWKNLFLLLVIAPFFVTYLIRTLAWETILSDNGFVVHTLQHLGILGSDGRLLATSAAVITGITYNFLPFMVLPLYVSLEQIDHRLIEAAEDLYASRAKAFLRDHVPALAARRVRRRAADVHPGGRRLHQRAAARHAAPVHDRQRHPVGVPRCARLPDGGGALVHPDGGDPRDGARVREGRSAPSG